MLKKTVLTFAFLTILTTFYGFNAQFSAPATDDALNALAEMHHSLLPEGSYVISAYDNLIRNISEEEGHDWRLMSAIAYHESRFTPDITSRSGARGHAFGGASVRRPRGRDHRSEDQYLVGQQTDVEDHVVAPFSGRDT